MANKRDPNKVLVGCFVDKELRNLLKKALEKEGLSITDFFHVKIYELLNKGADEIIKELKRKDGRTAQGKASRNRTSNKKASK